MKKTIGLVVLIAAIAVGVAGYFKTYAPAAPPPPFRLAKVQKGDLLSTISATGTLEPEELVDVGAQVMGRIVDFGIDDAPEKRIGSIAPKQFPPAAGGEKEEVDQRPRIDYGSVVTKGTVLAYIDPETYEAQAAQAAASLLHAKADLMQAKTKRDQAKEELGRADKLLALPAIGGVGDRPPIKAISDSDYTLVKVNYDVAVANVALAEASVKQAQAAKDLADINLRYTVIKSPVRGVIVDRRVNIGQTVVASLNAPSLFLIAKDLRRMQVWASVNEADIGRIHTGMPVRFTVDAHPGRTFPGAVTQVRMNATMTQNVVTYTVIVTADNPDGKLLPYLTANVQFEVDKRTSVLLVPNEALRWKPEAAQIDPAVSQAVLGARSGAGQERHFLWTLGANGLVRPVEVAVGATDGATTEVSGSEVKEEMSVVAGELGEEDQKAEEPAGADKDKTSNPFLPKLPKGSRPPPGPPM